MSTDAERAAGTVVERFAPTSGRALGYLTALAGLGLAVGAAASGVPANRGLLLFGIALTLVAWVVLIRPVVSAHQHGVLLRNMLRDTFVPWASIERTRALQTLQVVTPQGIYHGLGVSRSARSMIRESRRGAPTPGFFGVGSSGAFGRSYPMHDDSAAKQGATYSAYVESRLRDLGTRAAADGPDRPVISWSPLPLIALGAAVACAVLILV